MAEGPVRAAAASFSPENLDDGRSSAAHRAELRDCPGPSAPRNAAMFPSVSHEPLGASPGRGLRGLHPLRSTPHPCSSHEVPLTETTAEEQRNLDQDQPAGRGQNQGVNLGVSGSQAVTDRLLLPLQGRTPGSTSETQEGFLEEVLVAKWAEEADEVSSANCRSVIGHLRRQGAQHIPGQSPRSRSEEGPPLGELGLSSGLPSRAVAKGSAAGQSVTPGI